MKSKMRAIVIGILCVCLFAVVACHRESATKEGNATGPLAASGTPLEGITKAFQAQLALKSYRIKMETTTPQTGTQIRTAEYVAPDRFHWKGEKDEMIVVGSASYMRMGDKWIKSPIDAAAMVNSVRDPKFLDQLSKGANVTLVGPDVVDGTPALVYQYTLNNAFGANMQSTSKTWVRASDGMPLKVESSGEFNGMKTTTLATYYDFNADIKIEPPM